MGWVDESTNTETPSASPIRQFLAGPLGALLIPLLTGAAGALHRTPGRFGPLRGGISGGIQGALGGVGTVMTAQDQEAQRINQERVGKFLGPEFQRTMQPSRTTVESPIQPDISAYTSPSAAIEGTEGADLAYGGPGAFAKPIEATREVSTPASERSQRLAALGQALLSGGHADEAAKIYEQSIPPLVDKYATVRPGGAIVDVQTGKPIYQAAPAERPVAYQRRVEGGKVVTFNPQTNEVISREELTAAPERARSETEQKLDKARLAEITARTARVNQAMDVIRNPASLEKMPHDRLVLNRSRAVQDLKSMDALLGLPEEDRRMYMDAFRAEVQLYTREIARRTRGGTEGPQPGGKPTVQGVLKKFGLE